LVGYTIEQTDLAVPFSVIPEDMMEKAKLPALGYGSVLEMLGERFHVSPELLKRLNPSAMFDRPGEQILVPNVGSAPLPMAASVVVDRSEGSVKALNGEGKAIAYYPATIGSKRDPLPIGKWKVKGVRRDPEFHYNPKLFWDADRSHSKATIPPGPNNPVGVVWIDLSKEHYGIHGTPEPHMIGKTRSHGCIRLTNWDAAELATIVAPGIPAILQE
jgi:lipoprotein-anchoring transpeptidase ErfK/SrfK